LERRGQLANHKRVLRIMRDQSWLCRLQRRSRRTTLSDHGLPVFPNLLKEAVITGLNQVWVADITYIRLPSEFVFLAAILDAYSRKVVGWHLSRRLDVSLSLTALECALAKRQIPPGVIHHSDQGVQYAAGEYVAKAREAGMLLSMSRRGQPKDNPQAESFFRTLKMEQVYLSEYLDFDDAQRQIGHFIEAVYNHKRLHSAIGYVPPVEFEAKLAARAEAESLSKTPAPGCPGRRGDYCGTEPRGLTAARNETDTPPGAVMVYSRLPARRIGQCWRATRAPRRVAARMGGQGRPSALPSWAAVARRPRAFGGPQCDKLKPRITTRRPIPLPAFSSRRPNQTQR
jgi:putative transposase